MAVAVTSSAAEPNKAASTPLGLIPGSVIGAALVLGAFAVVFRFIPGVWNSIGDWATGFTGKTLLMLFQLAASIGLVVAGTKVIGKSKTTPGLRGGIFLMISTIIALFFVLRALYILGGKGFTVGSVILMAINVGFVFLIAQLFRQGRFAKWSVGLDNAGWFSTTTHKRTQGLRVRRLTTLGVLLIAGTGIWTLLNHNWLPANAMVRVNGTDINNRMGDWIVGGTQMKNPAYHDGGFTILPDLNITMPLILIAAALWFAWRLVNYPMFADFLIATEAEMNKVSWSSRKSLIRDTIVVIVSLILITVFLFLVDIFWGWVLSRQFPGILPTDAEKPAKPVEVKVDKW